MRLTFLIVASLLFCRQAFPQEIVFSPDDWQNPAVFSKNQVKPHALIIPFSSEKAALEGEDNGSHWVLSLDGTWKFFLAPSPAKVPEGFFKPEYDVKAWHNIKVPANWEMEGFGHPKFRNIAMTIDTKPPFVPEDDNPTGCYRLTFNIPSAWKNRSLLLRFEGVKSASCVWINGKPAGYNEGGFEPAEYDITPFTNPGRNEIAVQVMRYCDGSFLENQDMWRLSGIFRSVVITAVPKVHLRDYYVVTDLDEAYRNANLKVTLDVKNSSATIQKGFQTEIRLLDSSGQPVTGASLSSAVGELSPGENKQVILSANIDNPLKWSAEKPHLYTLVMMLKNESGKVTEVTAKKMGFREVEIKNQAIWVNGSAVKFNGVNSHMHHPETGQAVPYETLKKDLLIMKQFNINAVRTCHYPPSPEYLKLADELGMYIFDETGDECHDNEYLSEDPAWKAMFVERSEQLVYRDRNHPSVVVWSAGNEAGEGENIKAVIEAGKKIDPSRPGWMYGGNTFHIPFEDIVGPRYWRPMEIKSLAEGKVLPAGDNRPSFQDEYLAATGNGLGGLDEYWELIWKYPRLTGGAIWDWISPGLTVPLAYTSDRSPLHHQPVIMGRPEFVAGPDGKALKLSGNDDWVEFYRDPSLDLAGSALTVEFRVNPSRIRQPNTFITKGSHQFGIIQPNQGQLEFYLSTGKRLSVKADVPANWYGNWHHVAGVFDDNSLALYINYKKVAEAPCKGKMTDTPYPVCIGRDAERHDQGEHRGLLSSCLIDDVRIYERAFSPEALKNFAKADAAAQSVASLDFEETSNEGTFFSTGLGGRTYGIIWPDRNIQPEIHQIKKSAQPVLIEAADLKNGNFRITNRFNFTGLEELNAVWLLESAGKITGSGKLQLSCQPGESKVVEIPYQTANANQPGEKWLTISFSLKEATSWAPKGHEIAWEQFLISGGETPASLSAENAVPVSTVKDEDEVIITGKDFTYRLNAKTGRFTSILYKGSEIVKDGPSFSVWRAPLANDMDPWGSDNFDGENFTPGQGRSVDNQLRSLGLNNLVPQVDKLDISSGENGEAVITIHLFTLGVLGKSGFEHLQELTVAGDGTITLNNRVIPQGEMPGLLPRVGWELRLPQTMNNLEWFGRGPFETYPDRKTAARIGNWKSNITDEYVPYLIPQDYGNKTDVSWLKISDSENAGLLISCDEQFNFSAHAYSTDNLTRAVYPFQLKKAGYITLNVDHEVSGVGDTARRTLTKYRVFPAVKTYCMIIRPFRN